jgi:hypothetical protein
MGKPYGFSRRLEEGVRVFLPKLVHIGSPGQSDGVTLPASVYPPAIEHKKQDGAMER